MDTQRAQFAARPRPLVLALSIAYAGVFLAMPAQAQNLTAASAATADYAIGSGPLEQTLLSIGRQSGRTIGFDPALVKGHSAPPVSGRFSVEDAVRKALSGSGLELLVAADGVLTIKTSASASQASADSAPVATAPVAQLKAIQVVAERDQAETSFKVDRSSTSTRSDTDLMDLPTSVTVVTSKVLETQQVTSVQEALGDVSGLTFKRDPQGGASYSIRGMNSTALMSNGLSDSSAVNTEVAGIERIEVLKGPQAILVGSDAMSGGVNVVTKKPQADPIHEITMQYGTYGDKIVSGDFSGALTEDKKLTYRFVASGEQESFSTGGYNGKKAEYFLPELRWKDDTTDVIIGYTSANRHTPATPYTLAYQGGVQPTPGMRLGNASDGFDTQSAAYFYDFTQKISDKVKLVSKVRFVDSSNDMKIYSPNPMYDDTMIFYGTRSATHQQQLSGDHYLETKFGTGPIGHDLTVGFNHSLTHYRNSAYYNSDYPIIDIYSQDQYPFARVEGDLSSTLSERGNENGAYFLDHMSWGKWQLVGGLRRTQFSQKYTTLIPGSDVYDMDTQRNWETTPTVGVVYNITPSISSYVNYAQGYVPQFLNVCGGGASPSLRTRNKEGGLKFDLLDSRLSLTTSYFQLDEVNTSTYNSIDNCYTLIPSQKTRGVELDLQGKLATGWSLILNGTYSSIEDASGSIVRFAAQPKKKASMWTTYEFQAAPLHGFGLGLGFAAYDGSFMEYQYANSADVPKLPGAVRVDSSVFYRQQDWSVNFGIKNLFDRDLYGASGSRYYVPLQGRRTASLTLKYNF